MKQITNRNDINILVSVFYSKIREDDILGSIFNTHIANDLWEGHLDKLTDFWETNLFGLAKFKGNPTLKHINVDKNLGYKIEQKHFDSWLQIWFETINELYEREYAEKAKNSAKKMATGQFFFYFTTPRINKIKKSIN